MLSPSEKRQQTMLKKFGGPAGLKKHYQDMKQKSMEHPHNSKGTAIGGFSLPEVAEKASRLGVEARRARKG